jgi:hypothetical protein
MARYRSFFFGNVEGFIVLQTDFSLNYGQTYEAPAQGVSLFCRYAGGVFRAARWELWQIC